MQRTQPVVGAVLAALALAGCGASGSATSSAPPVVQMTTTQTLTPPPATSSFTPAPASSVAALGSAQAPMPAGETEGTCPYISNASLADTEGDHVYRTSLLTTTSPRGCRFYFYAGPFEAIADIVPATFPTATEAYNAMVATGNAGVGVLGVKNLIPGVDAVLYKTTFFGKDGPNGDWACAFAKGSVLVVVHTQQTNVSYNARAIAAAIAPKF